MSHARHLVGDVFDVLATLEDQSVHSVITSPPYWQQKRYLPESHPLASKEIGQESSPGEFLATLLRLSDDLWRVLRDDGSLWVNLGDTSSGSGGSGGDYNEGGRKADQAKYVGSARAAGEHGARIPWKGKREGHPPAKSLCFIPHLFGASLAYGRNLLTGEPCEQWVVRNVVTWCKPSINPGRCDDRFRRATELMIFASKGPRYYWDKASILKPLADSPGNRYVRKVSALDAERRPPGVHGRGMDNRATADHDPADSKGAPPFDWWVVSTSSYKGAHYATFPPDLIVDPVLASCPPGGTILDPFGGSGTTAAVATGHGRDCISIDIDERNADLARERVGMFLDVEAPDLGGVA